jgi:glycosyltransferase involved in cell wall biosynthesis
MINEPLDKVICVSRYGYECMTALDLLPADRYGVVYNGVDLSRMARNPERAEQFRRKYEIPEGRAIVLQVSWIIPEKGIRDVLEAARSVVSARPNVQFVFVGMGPYESQFRREATAMGLNGNITWTGLVEDPLAEGVYDAADILCQASRWEELFGWSISEGMAFGKPVVATRVGGIPELIKDGENGFLVDRGDTSALAEKISRLIDDPLLRERMGRAGYEAALAKFDLRMNVTQLLHLYGVEPDGAPRSEPTRLPSASPSPGLLRNRP